MTRYVVEPGGDFGWRIRDRQTGSIIAEGTRQKLWPIVWEKNGRRGAHPAGVVVSRTGDAE
jgi:hypothetical protein